MITALRLGNARLFDDDGWSFPFSSLTALCGTNSAGKSTALKTLLLLRLNIGLRGEIDFDRTRLRFSGAGTQIDLGNFKSFISHNCTTKQLHLGVSITTALSPEGMDQLLGVPSPDIDFDLDVGENSTRRPHVPYTLHCDFHFGLPSTRQEKIGFPPEDASDDLAADEQAVLQRAMFRIADDTDATLLDISIDRTADESEKRGGFTLSLHRRMFAFSFPSLSEGEPEEAEILTVPTILRGLLPDRWSIPASVPKEVYADFSNRPLPLPPVVEEVFGDLRRELGAVSYLGPLRAPAKRYYTLQQDYSLAADTTGEFLPYLLRERPNQAVVHAKPVSNELIRSTLSGALDYWLFYLRTGETGQGFERELNVSNYQDVLVQLQIRSSFGQERHSLTDSGFGYSQVLPILARGLLMPRSGTLIVEQPELHLNPALQVRLADFFIAITSCGKQVLLETHSEHLIDALRARSAEDVTGNVARSCMVLFLDAEGGKPKLHDLRVKNDGTIPEWPVSFFGEASSLASRILKAQRLHRTVSRQPHS